MIVEFVFLGRISYLLNINITRNMYLRLVFNSEGFAKILNSFEVLSIEK